MSSEEEFKFKCVFCKETFSDKETLQIHFRKHGDPSFNSNSKQKIGNKLDTSSEKSSKDEPELVSCDVCTESFPTISKAITHKHKMHPEHTAKYFCPWCGKLFTMKHLYNKHIQSSHETMVKSDEVFFHCDPCDVDFYVPSAMQNHNKFFHRQEADSHDLGQSKKLKMFNQETYLLYYCSFCGEEYNNKVNLQKHREDDHSDADNSFTEVMRCPMCDAVFYYLDAYELHLSFHATNDLYSDVLHPDFSTLTEFSLETVPPIMEKIENEAMDVDNFLELALADTHNNEDTGESSERVKSKKRKKHKKSKKEAMTLDEFLNMSNIFGEGIDVQGIEEVPKQAITSQLKKRPKSLNSNTPSTKDLQKLRMQGITIKKKSNNIHMQKPIVMKQIPKDTIAPNKANIVDTSNEALNKLINQTNNQIRIVKKPIQENKAKASPVAENPHSPKVPLQGTGQNEENESIVVSSTQVGTETVQKDNVLDPKSENMTDLNISKANNDFSENLQDVTDVINNPNRVKNLENAINPLSSLKNLSSNITIKSDKSVNEQNDLLISCNKNCLPGSDNHVSGINAQNNSSETPNKTLSALKHLSHLITVKSIIQNSDVVLTQDKTDTYDMVKNDQNCPQRELTKDTSDEEANIPQNVTSIQDASIESKHKDISKTPLDSLKNISKNITIKSLTKVSNMLICSSPKVSETNENNEEKDYDQILLETNAKNCSSIDKNMQQHIENILTTKPNNSPSTDCEMQPSSKVESASKGINEDILKRLTNITAKPVSTINNSNNIKSSSSHAASSAKNVVQNSIASYKITDEIFSIDDSDSDEIDETLKNKNNIETLKKQKEKQSKDIFKAINKNISVKPITQVKTEETSDDEDTDALPKNFMDHNDGEFSNTSRNIMLPQPNTVLNNILMNMSKNITIKSRNTSSSLSKKLNEDQVHHSNFSTNDDNDFDSFPGKVKITEVDDEKVCDDGQQQSNAVIESPDHTSSDKDFHSNYEQDLNDFVCDDDMPESPITDTGVINSGTPADISQFKNLSKNITIKSVNQSKEENNGIKDATPTLPHLNKSSNTKSNKQVVLRNEKHGPPVCDSTLSQTASSQVNTINKQVKVQTYESETIIEEITTTVTKTIRKVNQTVQQQNVSQRSSAPVRLQKVLNMPTHMPGLNIQKAIRQIRPNIRPNVRNCTPSIRSAASTTARPLNQLVTVRPRMNLTGNNPRMPMLRKPSPSTQNQRNPLANKPIRISPQVKLNQTQKRPMTTEETPGPFSCFKKPKESPLSEFSGLGSNQGENVVQYSSTSQMSKLNFSSSKQVVKGNAVVTSTQAKSAMSASSQQLSKLNNMSGLKVVKTSQSMTHIEEKEVCASKRSALEAIEKLQRQGLLVKKPCADYNECSEHSNSDIDE